MKSGREGGREKRMHTQAHMHTYAYTPRHTPMQETRSFLEQSKRCRRELRRMADPTSDSQTEEWTVYG